MNVCLTCLHRPTTKKRPHTSIDLCSVEITGALYCAGSVQQELRIVQDIGLAFKRKVIFLSLCQKHKVSVSEGKPSLSLYYQAFWRALSKPLSFLVCTVVCTDPIEPHRDPQRSLNLGIITCQSHRDYERVNGGIFFYINCCCCSQTCCSSGRCSVCLQSGILIFFLIFLKCKVRLSHRFLCGHI